jgi:hypothetical protein
MMKRLVPMFVCAAVVALLVAQVAPAATVTVRSSQGVGTRVDWTVGTTAQTGLTGVKKAGLRNNIPNPPGPGALDPTTGNSSKIWLQFDLSDVWATHDKADLTSVTLTLWGENGPTRRFDVSGLNDGLVDYDEEENPYSLETWNQNTLNWFNAPGNTTNSGYMFSSDMTTSLWQVYSTSPVPGTPLYMPSLGSDYDQCSRYISGDISAYIATDTDGKVTLMMSDGPYNDNQNWWVGPSGSYDVGPTYQLNGEVIRDSPTLTLTFVPEPATLAILGLGGLLLRRRLA